MMQTEETKDFIRLTAPIYKDDNNLKQGTVAFSIACGDSLSKEVWYRFSTCSVSDTCDFLLPACLSMAMRYHSILKIPGKVSAQLLCGAKDIQQILRVWNPGFSIVEIKTEGISQKRAQPGVKVASFFSGGVDSAYTLLKHLDEIDSIIFVHGFDISLENAALREEASKAMKMVAQELGKELIEVETNLREFSNPHAGWGRVYFGAALASVALLLPPRFRKVYIPASHTYKDLFPRGSHPLLDPLWSTEAIQIIHDGCEANRVEKVAFIAQNDVLLKHLRVCWENRGGAYNCGECEKCLRTMINLKAVGALERCPAFNRPLNLSQVSHIEADEEHVRVFIEENLQAVENFKTDPELADALRKCLAGHWKGLFGWRYFARQLSRKYLFFKNLAKIFRKLFKKI